MTIISCSPPGTSSTKSDPLSIRYGLQQLTSHLDSSRLELSLSCRNLWWSLANMSCNLLVFVVWMNAIHDYNRSFSSTGGSKAFHVFVDFSITGPKRSVLSFFFTLLFCLVGEGLIKLEYLRGCQFLMFLYMIFSKINNSIQLEITKIKRNRVVRTWGIIREGLLEGGALIETLQSVLTISLTDVQSSIGLGVGWISFSWLYTTVSVTF